MQARRNVRRQRVSLNRCHPGFRSIGSLLGLIFLCFCVMAPTCSQLSLTNGNKISNITPTDGVKTVTYSTPDGGAVPAAAAAAFNTWNSVSGTGVKFVAAPSGTVGTVTVGSTTSDSCISTSGPLGTITYGTQFSPDLTNPSNANDAQLSFEHEIGHLLGLGDNTGNNKDIMDQSTGGCTPADSGYSWDAVPPTSTDGSQVGTCQAQEKGKGQGC